VTEARPLKRAIQPGSMPIAMRTKVAALDPVGSMIYGTLINGTLAFSYLTAILYCMGDYTEAVTSH
jgi:choline transport protein